MRGATIAWNVRMYVLTYFNPHSPCGERRAFPRAFWEYADFNPHSPCGERQHGRWLLFRLFRISIHTPHAGSDTVGAVTVIPAPDISIHTPHAGSDGRRNLRKEKHKNISIHTPHAGSDEVDRYPASAGTISIHTPHAGSDFIVIRFFLCGVISIHTPHAGSDYIIKAISQAFMNFNPHSPCGERHSPPGSKGKRKNFNPHSPCGERRQPAPFALQAAIISIHTPHAGSDRILGS